MTLPSSHFWNQRVSISPANEQEQAAENAEDRNADGPDIDLGEQIEQPKLHVARLKTPGHQDQRDAGHERECVINNPAAMPL